MKIFLDTANVDEIREAVSWGIIEGVTTNPSLAAKEGKPFREVLGQIVSLVNGPVSAEVLSTESSEMVREAKELAQVGKNVVIKVPICPEGLKAVSILSKMGISTNVTLVFSANQGLVAALSGATFVSPFVGRLDDVGNDGMEVVRDLARIFSIHSIPTKIIAASIRHPMHVVEAAKAGAQIATVPFKVLESMIRHPLTEIGMERFRKDWDYLVGNLNTSASDGRR